MEAKIDSPQSNTKILGQGTPANLGRLTQTARYFELDFFLKTSQFLKWGHKAQGNLGTLPPCRFTISKRGTRGVARVLEQKPLVRRADRILPYPDDFEKGFSPNGQKREVLQLTLRKPAGATRTANALTQNLDQYYNPTLAIGHLVDTFNSSKRHFGQTDAFACIKAVPALVALTSPTPTRDH